MTWRDLVLVQIGEDYGLRLGVGPLALLLVGVGLVIAAIVHRRRLIGLRRWDVVEGDVKLGGIGSVKVRPNREDAQIAHSAWVELATRKAGLAFDPDHDVIVEVYSSWYELFREMRHLAKSCPAYRVRDDEDACKTIDTMVDALNRGLRPHLTRWQARFRRWYEQALKEHPEKSPQEIQRQFPQYQELIADLQRVNTDMMDYMKWLRKVATGRS